MLTSQFNKHCSSLFFYLQTTRLKNTIFGLVLATFLLATTGAVNAQLKIALLDPQRAVLATTVAEKLIENLKEEYKSELETINRLSDEITKLEETLKKDNEIISNAAKNKLRSKIRLKKLRRDGQAQILQELQKQRIEELAREMQPKLQAVLNDLIEIEGYDLVLPLNPQNILYVNPKHDVTRKVTEKLDERQ